MKDMDFTPQLIYRSNGSIYRLALCTPLALGRDVWRRGTLRGEEVGQRDVKLR